MVETLEGARHRLRAAQRDDYDDDAIHHANPARVQVRRERQ